MGPLERGLTVDPAVGNVSKRFLQKNSLSIVHIFGPPHIQATYPDERNSQIKSHTSNDYPIEGMLAFKFIILDLYIKIQLSFIR